MESWSSVKRAFCRSLGTTSRTTSALAEGSCRSSRGLICSSRCWAASGDRGTALESFSGKRSTYSSKMSWAQVTGRAPWRSSQLGPSLMGASMFPGMANTSRFCSMAWLTVSMVPLCRAHSTATTPRARPLMIRLRTGKCSPLCRVPGGYSLMRAPAAATSS